ncbi:MAG: hypothetical protein L3J04_04255 [Robiginitomaculum sp.]|nr:hypothetical protein [Robiginitomaculum sp.]
MSRYSISDAVFFAISHDKKSKHFKRLAIAYILLKIIFFILIALIAAPFMGSLMELFSTDLTSEAAQLELGAKISVFSNIQTLGGLLFLPFFLAVMASFYRWTVNDDWSKKRLGLRFGATELHLFLVYLVVYGLVILVALLMMIPFVIAAVTLGNSDTEFNGYQFLMFFFGGLVYFAILIWLSVKLSLAAALTVRHGDIKIFESFSASKGHFWKLFGSYLFLMFIYMVAAMALFIMAAIIVLPFFGIGVAVVGMSPTEADYLMIAALAVIPIVLITIIALWIEFWAYVASAGIGAYFVRWKEGDPVERVAKEFE